MYLVWNINNADIDYINGDPLTTDIIISLFTDARALDSDMLPSGTDKRGWWGDSYNERPIGSKLWLLSREKQLSSVLKRAQEYAQDALNWLVRHKKVQSINVIATSPQNGLLQLDFAITKLNGETLKHTLTASIKDN